MLKAQDLLGARVQGYFAHVIKRVTADNAQLSADNAIMLKAVQVSLGAVKKLTDEVAELRGTSRGRKGAPAMLKGLLPGGGSKGSSDLPDLDGRTLMLKAVAARGQDVALLSMSDIGDLEGYTNHGLGLRQIAAGDPTFATRVHQAITTAAAAAH